MPKMKKKQNWFVRFISTLGGAIMYVPRKLGGFIWSSVSRGAVYIWGLPYARPLLIAGTPLVLIYSVFAFSVFAPIADTAKPYIWKYSAAAGFRIDYVDVKGRKRTDRADLQKAVGLTRGQSIFTIDLPAIHKRVQTLAWVKDVSIIRRLPDRIDIILYEYEPFALYQKGKKKVLVNRQGVEITTQHLHQFKALPVFSGKKALSGASALMDLLADYPVVRNRLVAAHWAGQRRWDLVLDHGGTLHLPESDIRAALDRLMQQERQRRILAQKQVIDLRLPDRILLRPISTPASNTQTQESLL